MKKKGFIMEKKAQRDKKLHSLQKLFPGKIEIDLWGWTGTVNYQRTKENISPDYFIEKIVKESNIWGANFVEYFPFKEGVGGFVIGWDPDDPIRMPQGFYPYPDPKWTDTAIRRLAERIHDADMVAVWCINALCCVGSGGWGKPGANWVIGTPSDQLDVLEKFCRDFFNVFLWGSKKTFDVFDTEYIAGGEIPIIWTYNPGATPMLCAVSDFSGEGYTYSFCCAGLKRHLLLGLDDHTSYQRSKSGPYFSYQADSRVRRSTESGWGHFGGYSCPDWLMKQAFDYCRVRVTSANNFHTALWWFNETEEMRDPGDRRYVYGLMLDPLRSAVALRLFVTGRFDERILKFNPDKIGGLEYYPFPRGTPIIQNNHLRLYFSSWQDQKTIVYDRSHLGHYDDNNPDKLTLSNVFLKTSVQGRKNSSGVIGFVDGSDSEFSKAWDGKESYDIGEVKVSSFPRGLGFPPHLPRKISLRFQTAKDGWYMLSVAQCPTKNKGKVSVVVNEVMIGEFATKTLLESSGTYIHIVPFKVHKGFNRIDLKLKSESKGFAFDAISLQEIKWIGVPDDTNREFRSSGGYREIGEVYDFYLGRDSTEEFPGGLEPKGDKWPRRVNISFDAKVGLYVFYFRLSGKGPLEFFLDGERILVETLQLENGKFGDIPVFFGITEEGKHTISLMTWMGQVEFDAVGVVRLFDESIVQCIEEPVGYLATIREGLNIPMPSGNVSEVRRYTLKDDALWVEVEINRRTTGKVGEVCSVIGCKGYTSLHVGKLVYKKAVQLEKVPEVLVLKDERSTRPDIVLTFIEKGNTKGISFFPESEIRIISDAASNEKLRYAMFVPEVLYGELGYGQLMSLLDRGEEFLDFDTGNIEVSNRLPLPMVRIIGLKGSKLGPFYVMERNSKNTEHSWWMFRGGQPAVSGDCTYVRVYLQGMDRVKIQRYGYIDGKVKGGVGSQYIIAIRDDIGVHSCTVEVLNVTPYVPAPSVVFKEKFTSVKLNGEEWRYYEGNTVYLPSRRGTYRIKTSRKEKKVPHILRTQASVKEIRWDGYRLVIDIGDPVWYKKKKCKPSFYMVGIALEGYSVINVSNEGKMIPFEKLRLKSEADLEKMRRTGAVLKLKTGKTEIVFRKT